MIKLTIKVNEKQTAELGLLNLIESRLSVPLKEGDKVEFMVEDTIAPVKHVFTETKYFKVNPKS